jgi:hypothetical protein
MNHPVNLVCKYTKGLILMGHTLWYGAGKELASNLTAAWCRDRNTMARIPCFVQRLTRRYTRVSKERNVPRDKKFPCPAVPLSLNKKKGFLYCCPFVLGQEQQQKSRDILLFQGIPGQNNYLIEIF